MFTGYRLLVVDAADDSRGRTVLALARAGFVIDEAASGAGALERIRTLAPDLVVLDLELPDLDGFEIRRRLSAEPGTRHLPLLFLSATYEGLEVPTGAVPGGAEAYLARPWEPPELVSAVTNLLRLRAADGALRAHDSVMAVAAGVGGTEDMTEALRLVCRELAHLTGADTVGAHLLDRERDELRPVAGYRIPKDAIGVLSGSAVPRQPFWPVVLRSGEVVWSDDVPADSRFEFHLFRGVPHQSGVVIPLVIDGEVVGTFYLVWWKERHQLDPSAAALLQTIGRQVGLLLRTVRSIEEARLRRRIAEAAKAHYQLLFDRNLAGVFRSAGDGRILECNEAFARLLRHHGPDDTRLHNAREFYAEPADLDRLLARLGSDRRVANHEMRWRRATGDEFTVLMNATQVGEGPEAHIEGIVLDVSDVKQAEAALHAREAQIRHLGDNLPDGVIYQVVRRLDGSNYFPYMSSGLARTFGVSPEDAANDPGAVYRLILPKDLPRLRAAADESIRTGEPFEAECRLRVPDGTVRWLNIRGRPTRLADGATQWDAIAVDVTERKRAEEALRERETRLRELGESLRRSEERYRMLFERSFVGIFRTRPDGILADCNDAFARLLGYPDAAAARGRSVIGHYATPADRDVIIARMAAGEPVLEAEFTCRRLDGTLVPVAMSVRRLVDADGPIHEGVLVDLTDRKRAEEAAALRSVAALANAAGHEINNPLAIIVGQLELMRGDRKVASRVRAAQLAADRIRDIVKHMTRITRLQSSTEGSPRLPRMLDIRGSAVPPDEAVPAPDLRDAPGD